MSADRLVKIPLSLEKSTRYCQQLARRRAGNFYFAFLTLPKRDRRDMSILYAYMRHCDDIGDEPDHPIPERKEQLRQWRETVDDVLSRV